MTSPTFTPGQRVFDRRLKRYGTFIKPSWTTGESIVVFDTPDGADYEDLLGATTAQLVPAEEVNA